MATEFFKQLSADDVVQRNWREDGFRDELGNGIIVDTCKAADTNQWETGIKQNGEWYVAEDYDSMRMAEEGHKRWVRVMTENPSYDLRTCDQEFLSKWLNTESLPRMGEIIADFDVPASQVKPTRAKPEVLTLQKR